MSKSGSKIREQVAHFLVDIHTKFISGANFYLYMLLQGKLARPQFPRLSFIISNKM